MEYVDGMPITLHAEAHALDLRARLDLFLIVCHAVEAAQRALIMHREIKPSKILVGEDGTVKLLDFRIAKLLEEEIDSATVACSRPTTPHRNRSSPVRSRRPPMCGRSACCCTNR